MTPAELQATPDSTGHYGDFGGMFVPETLMAPLQELAEEYEKAKADPAFQAELDGLLADFCGRKTPLYYAERLTEKLGGAKIYLKREDLLHTGAHKINNAIGQALIARRLGKTRIIAETGAGQHGVATATVCARFGMECVVYMGAVDMERQALNVARMRLMGAEVRGVEAGQRTLKEAVNEAMRDWVASVENTHYIIGSALGSHPFPMMVRDFHRVIGVEAREQILEKEGRLPDISGGLCGWRFECDWTFPSLLGCGERAHGGGGSRRRRHYSGASRGSFSGREARCSARDEDLVAGE